MLYVMKTGVAPCELAAATAFATSVETFTFQLPSHVATGWPAIMSMRCASTGSLVLQRVACAAAGEFGSIQNFNPESGSDDPPVGGGGTGAGAGGGGVGAGAGAALSTVSAPALSVQSRI